MILKHCVTVDFDLGVASREERPGVLTIPETWNGQSQRERGIERERERVSVCARVSHAFLNDCLTL